MATSRDGAGRSTGAAARLQATPAAWKLAAWLWTRKESPPQLPRRMARTEKQIARTVEKYDDGRPPSPAPSGENPVTPQGFRSID